MSIKTGIDKDGFTPESRNRQVFVTIMDKTTFYNANKRLCDINATSHQVITML